MERRITCRFVFSKADLQAALMHYLKERDVPLPADWRCVDITVPSADGVVVAWSEIDDYPQVKLSPAERLAALWEERRK